MSRLLYSFACGFLCPDKTTWRPFSDESEADQIVVPLERCAETGRFMWMRGCKCNKVVVDENGLM